MDNCNKIKNTCTDSTFATCIDYENDLGENTNITSDCVTIDDTTKDLYELVDALYDQIDLTGLGADCITYIGSKTLKEVLEKYEEEICELKTRVTELETVAICNMSIESCDLSLGILVDSCGEVPTSLSPLLQAMITQINLNTV